MSKCASESVSSKSIVIFHMAVYLVFMTVSLWLMGGGHGSYVHFVLLWAWGAFPFAMNPNVFTLFICPFLVTISYAAIWILARRLRNLRKNIIFALPALHVLGVFASWRNLPPDFRGEGVVLKWTSFGIGLYLIGVYWVIYLTGFFAALSKSRVLSVVTLGICRSRKDR